MSNREAFELFVKYAGEKSIIMVQEMIMVAGIETALKNSYEVLKQRHPEVAHEFKNWMRQSFEYIQREMIDNKNN